MRNDVSFGDLSRREPILSDGVWDLVIEDVKEAVDNTGAPKMTDNGLIMVDVVFEASDGAHADKVNRRCSPSLRQNSQTKVWSVLSQIIKAALGVPYGQQNGVTPAQLKGVRLRGVGEHNESGYPRLTSFLPAENRTQQASRHAPAPRDANPTSQTLDEMDEDSIPF